MTSTGTTSPRSSTTSSPTAGADRVNWVGHSLGGMIIFPYPGVLEPAPGAGSPTSWRWESTIALASTPPKRTCSAPIGASRASPRRPAPGRLGRPLDVRSGRRSWRRSTDSITRMSNVDKHDRRPVLRLHPRKPRPRAAQAARSHTWNSAISSRTTGLSTTSAMLPRVRTPLLMVAGDGGRSDVQTSPRRRSPSIGRLQPRQASLMRFGKLEGQVRRLRPLRPRLEPIRPGRALPPT